MADDSSAAVEAGISAADSFEDSDEEELLNVPLSGSASATKESRHTASPLKPTGSESRSEVPVVSVV